MSETKKKERKKRVTMSGVARTKMTDWMRENFESRVLAERWHKGQLVEAIRELTGEDLNQDHIASRMKDHQLWQAWKDMPNTPRKPPPVEAAEESEETDDTKTQEYRAGEVAKEAIRLTEVAVVQSAAIDKLLELLDGLGTALRDQRVLFPTYINAAWCKSIRAAKSANTDAREAIERVDLEKLHTIARRQSCAKLDQQRAESTTTPPPDKPSVVIHRVRGILRSLSSPPTNGDHSHDD